MSETSDRRKKCPWCDEYQKKDDFAVHLMKHLDYKKYDCGDCSSAFYTEAEREHHCKKKSHMHAFTVCFHPWKEMVLTSFIRDTKLLEIFDEATVLKHRGRLMDELDDFLLKKVAKNGKKTGSKTATTPVVETRRSRSLTRKSAPSPLATSASTSRLSTERSGASLELSDLSVPVVDKSQARNRNVSETNSTSDTAGAAENRSGVNLQSPRASTSRLSSDSLNSLSNSTIILSAAINMSTEVLHLKCQTCKKMVENDYLIRKDHVASKHMTGDHGPSDYMEILESKMRACFPGQISNDLQCQLSGCGKMYNSKSGRRGHVMRVHFQDELKCPMAGCTFGASDPARVHQHAKEDHRLNDGYRSMTDHSARQKFEFDRRSHNYKLDALVQKAFPGAIPPSDYMKGYSVQVDGAETVTSLIETLRKTERISQPNMVAPPPLRAPSPDSDSSSESDSEVLKSEKSVGSPPSAKKSKELKQKAAKERREKEEDERKKKEEDERKRKEEEERKMKEDEERRQKEQKEEEDRQRELERKQRKKEEKKRREEEERERKEAEDLENRRLEKEARKLEKAERKRVEQEERDRAAAAQKEKETTVRRKLELRDIIFDEDEEEEEDEKPDVAVVTSTTSDDDDIIFVEDVTPAKKRKSTTSGSVDVKREDMGSRNEIKLPASDLLSFPSQASTHSSMCSVSVCSELKDEVKEEDDVQLVEGVIERRVKGEKIFVQETDLCTPPPPRKRTLLEAPVGVPRTPLGVPIKRALLSTPSVPRLPLEMPNTDRPVAVVVQNQTPRDTTATPTTVSKKPLGQALSTQRGKARLQTAGYSRGAWDAVVTMRKALAIIRQEEPSPIELSNRQKLQLKKLYNGFMAANRAKGISKLSVDQTKICRKKLQVAAKASMLTKKQRVNAAKRAAKKAKNEDPTATVKPTKPMKVVVGKTTRGRRRNKKTGVGNEAQN